MTERALEQRVDEAESRFAIDALVAGYCVGLLSNENADTFMALWHPDAEYLIPARDDYFGIERIRDAYGVIFDNWSRTFHWTATKAVTFTSPDRALGRVDVFAFQEKLDGSGVCWVGSTYFDVYERRSGEWKFASRTTQRWFVSPPLHIPLPPPA